MFDKDLILAGMFYGFIAILVMFVSWVLLSVIIWGVASPTSNYYRCSAIAKSQNKQFATSGWRNDTCYLYSNGKEERIKL